MNSRERMLAAINRQPVDRVPTDIWATPEVWQKLRDHFGADVDIRAELCIDGVSKVDAAYMGPALPRVSEDETINYWGMRTLSTPHEGGVYSEQVVFPLAQAESIDDLDAYAWPTTDWFDYTRMRETAARLNQTHVVECGYMAPFFFHNKLRGLEQSLVDPLLDPEFTHAIVNRIADFFFAHHRKMFEVCEGLIDIAQVTDDLGSQTGPLIGLDLYHTFYAAHHKRFIDLCHEFGIKVFHHDDGSIREFLPFLIGMGIDILNPIQWRCPGMDMDELKREFGDHICFHGAIDNQTVLPFGSPDDVRAEVRLCIDKLGRGGTGYILAPCHNLQVNTPIENILAMYDEAQVHGRN